MLISEVNCVDDVRFLNFDVLYGTLWFQLDCIILVSIALALFVS